MVVTWTVAVSMEITDDLAQRMGEAVEQIEEEDKILQAILSELEEIMVSNHNDNVAVTI